MTVALKKLTSELRHEVGREIVADPSLAHYRVNVAERDGIVVLTGVVDCYARKRDAEAAAYRVEGVDDVVNDIEIRWDFVHGFRDFDLMAEAPHLLAAHYLLRDYRLQVRIDGWVAFLSGRVKTLSEREEAERVIATLPSLRGVVNEIVVDGPRVDAAVLRIEAEEVVERALGSAARSVTVDVDGARRMVSLDGTVRTHAERVACRAALARTPGVAEIRDMLRVATR